MGEEQPDPDDVTDEELLAAVQLAEDVEPSFDVLEGLLEVQADPLLGYGAFGTVHYAVLIAESKTVALKAVSKAATRTAALEGNTQSSLREILFSEAQMLEALAVGRHRNMLKFHGWWHDVNHVFIAQQLCVGGELPQWLTRQPSYTEQVAAKVTYDLLQALTYCHGQGIVHRDVKPQNLLFTSHAPDAYLKLADWGLACRWMPGEGVEPMSEYCGTLDYASPEMLNGAYSATSDVWSAGVILHFLLTGKNPFRGPSKAATEHRYRPAARWPRTARTCAASASHTHVTITAAQPSQASRGSPPALGTVTICETPRAHCSSAARAQGADGYF